MLDRRDRESSATPPDTAFRALFHANPQPMWVYDLETLAFLEVNDAAVRRYGYSRDEFRRMTIADIRPPEDVPALRTNVAAVTDGMDDAGVWRHLTKTGEVLEVHITSHTLEFRGHHAELVLARDVTAERAAERELRRLNRALRMLSDANQALIRATDERTLLDDVCRIVVEVGGYRLAWVGLAEHDEARTVRPVAQAGFDEGYLERLRVSWGDDERGRGPTGTAIRTRQVAIARDIAHDPAFAPWRAAALERGYQSSAAVPLLAGDTVLGALNVYAAEPDAFDPTETRIVMELAEDLSFGVVALRTRVERDRAEEILRIQTQLQELITDIAADLITVDVNDLDTRIEDGMEAVGGFANAEMAYLFQISTDRTTCSLTHGWFAPGVAIDRARLRDLPLTGWPWSLPRLEQGRSFQLRTLRELPPEAETDRASWARFGIRSLLALPLRDGERLRGWVGFATFTRDADWSSTDLSVLERFRTALGNALQRQQVERALAESESQYRQLFENAPIGIGVADLRGTLLAWNSAMLRSGNYSADDVGRLGNVGALYADAAERAEALARFARDGALTDFPVRFKRKDGTAYDALLSLSRTRFRGQPCVQAIVVDVTERRRADEALRASETEYRTLFETMAQGVVYHDARGVIASANPAAQRILGLSLDQMQGRTSVDSRWRAIRDDGTDFPGEEHPAMVALRTGRDVRDVVMGVFNPQRDAYVWLLVNAVPQYRAGEARPFRVYATFDDITERRQLEAQLRQAQKMEAIGQLAGGVAHDFNNLLTVILGNSSVIRSEANLDPDMLASVEEIAAAADRAAGLTRQLLTFSRRQVTQTRTLDLSEVVGGTIKLLRRVVGEDVTLETRFAPELPPVKADPGMIEQVLMNLAVNARDAMPSGGRLLVALEAMTIDAAYVRRHPDAAPGRVVRLSVQDTGMGIPAAHLPHIFEPFFTTKEVGRGSGLGLATVFGIVQQHEGWIDVTSDEGRGTTFHVFLPATAASEKPAGGDAPVEAVRGGNETILVVEDEPAVRRLARTALERYGYRVLEAGSGPEALEIWSTAGDTVDLLLTDFVMPGQMSGRELADRLRAENPDLKIVYTSGYSAEIVQRGLAGDAAHEFLQKPYDLQALAATVRRCLDAG